MAKAPVLARSRTAKSFQDQSRYRIGGLIDRSRWRRARTAEFGAQYVNVLARRIQHAPGTRSSGASDPVARLPCGESQSVEDQMPCAAAKTRAYRHMAWTPC